MKKTKLEVFAFFHIGARGIVIFLFDLALNSNLVSINL